MLESAAVYTRASIDCNLGNKSIEHRIDDLSEQTTLPGAAARVFQQPTSTRASLLKFKCNYNSAATAFVESLLAISNHTSTVSLVALSLFTRLATESSFGL